MKKMQDDDFLKLLIAAGIAAGMRPEDAIERAATTISLLTLYLYEVSNDD